MKVHKRMQDHSISAVRLMTVVLRSITADVRQVLDLHLADCLGGSSTKSGNRNAVKEEVMLHRSSLGRAQGLRQWCWA